MGVVLNAVIVVGTVLAMEVAAWAMHRFVMHGPGWGWHRSHHEPQDGWFEMNDLFGVLFGAATVAIFVWLAPVWPGFWWMAAGITLYGLLYVLVHDGLVHQRWPFRHQPKHPYLKRLVQAHRLHHAVEGRDRCVSFGFLYAPPVRSLKRNLVRLHPAGLRHEAAE
jgi:beta-carotene 3-hydroxylase